MNISDLVLKLKEATALYDLGTPSISDDEFDLLEQELRLLDPQNPYFTQVGSLVRGGKIPLPMPMMGITQVQLGETEKWFAKNRHKTIAISDKMDGTSILLQYSTIGEFEAAFSRGNGTDGADLTRHVNKMDCVPKKIANNFGIRLFIRAEVELKEYRFIPLSKDYANPRNYVAGQMNRETADPYFYENVSVIAYTIYDTMFHKSEQLEYLQNNGFEIVNYTVHSESELSEQGLSELLAERKDSSAYTLDGLVLTVDDEPDNQVKFKINDANNYAEVEVVGVEWNASKNGLLKPRIQIKPTNLDGVVISYCTGFNAKFILDHKIGAGAIIAITRSGNVIPHVLRVIKEVDGFDSSLDYFDVDVEWSGVDVKLIHFSEDVEKKKILHFAETLKIANFGPSAVDALYEQGLANVQDIITDITLNSALLALGKNGNIFYASLVARLNDVTLETLADASGCYPAGIGTTRLASVSDSLGIPFNEVTTIGQLVSVDGVELLTAQKILDGNEMFNEFLKNIYGCYKLKEKVQMSNELEGVIVCFTGVRDAQLLDIMISKGATTSDSKFNVLVAKDVTSASGKAKKALDKNIPIISLAEARTRYL